MDRRLFLKTTPAALWGPAWLGNTLPAQTLAPVPALAEPHFPSRLYQFVWRNWELANLPRMAQVIAATPEQVEELGRQWDCPASGR